MMNDNKVVLCGANAYEKKYYFNKEFSKIPESIQEELHIICVLFTEEVGGAFMIGFDEDGSVMLITEEVGGIFTIGFSDEGDLEFETTAADEDYLYDDISAGLLVAKIRNTKQELLQSLELYYRVLFLNENVDDLLGTED